MPLRRNSEEHFIDLVHRPPSSTLHPTPTITTTTKHPQPHSPVSPENHYQHSRESITSSIISALGRSLKESFTRQTKTPCLPPHTHPTTLVASPDHSLTGFTMAASINPIAVVGVVLVMVAIVAITILHVYLIRLDRSREVRTGGPREDYELQFMRSSRLLPD
ncbi:hypothetical protein HDK77DRAFT_430413 [Phyllosticta capitalensis]